MNPRIPISRDPVSLGDYEALAAERLTAGPAAYLFGGSADEISVRENRAAFERTMLLPRVLVDMHEASTGITLFGDEYAAPVLVAPMGFQRLFHPSGEIGLAQAAAAMGTGFVLSSLASTTIEAAAAAGEGAPQWFQLYFQPDRAATLKLVQRAEAAGYRAIVVTVDAPVNGIRNREMRAGFHLPEGIQAENLTHAGQGLPPPRPGALLGGLLDHAPNWSDMIWLRQATALPLLLKGVLNPEDALKARELGFDGLIVSNHGGRVLDTAVPPLLVLPMIRRAVGERMTILLDGGIRRGTDIFKALASGANAVQVGRPIAAALAVAGPQGAARALRILLDEFAVTLALCGCPDPSQIKPHSILPLPGISGTAGAGYTREIAGGTS